MTSIAIIFLVLAVGGGILWVFSSFGHWQRAHVQRLLDHFFPRLTDTPLEEIACDALEIRFGESDPRNVKTFDDHGNYRVTVGEAGITVWQTDDGDAWVATFPWARIQSYRHEPHLHIALRINGLDACFVLHGDRAALHVARWCEALQVTHEAG